MGWGSGLREWRLHVRVVDGTDVVSKCLLVGIPDNTEEERALFDSLVIIQPLYAGVGEA